MARLPACLLGFLPIPSLTPPPLLLCADQQVAATVKGVSDLLLADLQPWKGRLVAEYRDERLTVGAADPLLG